MIENPFRGIVYGLGMALVCWVLIVLVAVALS